MGGKFEKVEPATQATHKSELAEEEVDQMNCQALQFARKIVVDGLTEI